MVRMFAGASTEEESRAYLQSRSTVLWKIMFWAFVTLLASQWLMYELIYPDVRPAYQGHIYVIGSGSLALMAFIWRVLLARRTLTLNQLFGIDLFYAAGSGTLLGAAALLAYDFPPAHYCCLIYGSFAMFTRAIVVPTSPRWTALISSVTVAPMLAASLVLAIYVDVMAPGPMFFISTLICGLNTQPTLFTWEKSVANTARRGIRNCTAL